MSDGLVMMVVVSDGCLVMVMVVMMTAGKAVVRVGVRLAVGTVHAHVHHHHPRAGLALTTGPIRFLSYISNIQLCVCDISSQEISQSLRNTYNSAGVHDHPPHANMRHF